MFLLLQLFWTQVSISLLVVDYNTTNKEVDTLVHDNCNKQKMVITSFFIAPHSYLLRFSFVCIRLSMDIQILSVTVELNMVVWFFIY